MHILCTPDCGTEPLDVLFSAILGGHASIGTLLGEFSITCSREKHSSWCLLVRDQVFTVPLPTAARFVYAYRHRLGRRPKLDSELKEVLNIFPISTVAAIFWPLINEDSNIKRLVHTVPLSRAAEVVLCDGHGALRQLAAISTDACVYNRMLSFSASYHAVTTLTIEQLAQLPSTTKFILFVYNVLSSRDVPDIAARIIIEFAYGLLVQGDINRLREHPHTFRLSPFPEFRRTPSADAAVY